MTIDGGLRQLFQDHMRDPHWQSVETGIIAPGVPDLNGCHLGVEIWVEMKLTDRLGVDMRSGQVGWLVKRTGVHGRCFIAVRERHGGGPRKGDPADRLWLFWGGHAREVMDDGLRREDLALGVWHGGPVGWRWHEIQDQLFHGAVA